jgi:lariat debranching enzyme
LQVVDVVPSSAAPDVACRSLCYDPEWLAIVKRTHHVMNRPDISPPADPRVSSAELDFIERKLAARCDKLLDHAGEPTGLYVIPTEFEMTVRPYDPAAPVRPDPRSIRLKGNPQTDAFLAMLELPHVVTVPFAKK